MLKRRLDLPGGLPDDCPRELHPYDLCCSGVKCDVALYPAFGAIMGICNEYTKACVATKAHEHLVQAK